MLCFGKQLHFTLDSAAEAMQQQLCLLNASHFVEVGGSSLQAADGLHIAVIHAFCESMRDTIESRPNQQIVVCPADLAMGTKSDACLLCGAFVLLFEDAIFDDVLSTFKDALQGCLAAHRAAIVDCWAALHRARALGWLGATDIKYASEPALDVEMASHYALAHNGGVHVLVPGKLLLFPAPAPLPADQAWADTSEPGRPTARRFSAAFLAALLSDLGVSAVACLGRTGGSDAAALCAGGLDVHDLALDARRPALLGAMDRLLALSRSPRPCFSGTAAAGRRCRRTPCGRLARCAGVAPMIAVRMKPKVCANLEHARPAASATRRWRNTLAAKVRQAIESKQYPGSRGAA